MRKFKTMAIARAVAVIGATIALVTGVTFASLGNTASITDNSINTASTGLKVDVGSGPTTSAPGFTLNNYVPGTDASSNFNLVNDGGVDLDVTVQVVPRNNFVNNNVTDYSKVHVKVFNGNNTTTGTPALDTTFASLLSGVAFPNNPLIAPSTVPYTAVLNIDPSGVSGPNAALQHFDIVFTGTQH